MSPRPSLQKVQYRLRGGRLERVAYRYLDGAAEMDPAPLIEGVSKLRLRYRDRKGEWRQRWDPTQISELPTALEMVIDIEGSGTIRQLFLIGAAG